MHECLMPLLDHRQPRSFCSACWGTTTSPDLAFTGTQDHPQLCPRHLSEIATSAFNHRVCTNKTGQKVELEGKVGGLHRATQHCSWPAPHLYPRLDTVCISLCSAILIAHSCQKDLIPTWDDECQQMHEFTMAVPGGDANE